MSDLIVQLKQEIIEALNLEEVGVDSIDTDAPLFIEGLGLDSIDALELTVLLEKKYGIKIQTAEEGKTILYSVRTMAEHIVRHQASGIRH
jgi:acyl carrier protein